MDLNIIYSDNNIAVIEKPAGVPSQPDKTGDADLLAAVRERFEYAGLVLRRDADAGDAQHDGRPSEDARRPYGICPG